MRDQITADLVVTGAKVAPPAVVSAASAVGSISANSILVWLTILYTAGLLFSLVVKNWGDWMAWWDARAADLRRIWARLRGRG